MDEEKLQKVLKDHALWLLGIGGECANLSYANLNGSNLSYANLSHANLSYANLSGANLCGTYLNRADLSYANLSGSNLCDANLSHANLNRADLSYANLSGSNLSSAHICGANLSGSNLCDANLSHANLSYANLSGSNLSGAHLSHANIRDVKYSENTAFFALQCPEEGSFVAWKKCKNNVIVKLLIPEDAKRSSATSRKCRASKAVVLEVIGAEKGISENDASFVYEVGKEVIPDSFDDNRWSECSHGIHFFMTRSEAERY
jgi:hypothetical protein